MKLLVFLGLIFPAYSWASTNVSCVVEKTLVKYNPETQKLDVRKATSNKFLVTDQPHEDVKTLPLLQNDGSSWGEVSVVTGSHDKSGVLHFYANATVTDQKGFIIGNVTLKSPHVFDTASAMSMIFDSSEMPPTIELICSRNTTSK